MTGHELSPWRRNLPILQLACLAPLLPAVISPLQGLGLGLTLLFALVITCGVMSLLQRRVDTTISTAVVLLLSAAIVSCADLLLAALLPQLRSELGGLLPLLAGSCTLWYCAEVQIAAPSPWQRLRLAAMVGMLSMAVLVLVGFLRGLMGTGALWGDAAPRLVQLLLTPAGGLILMGCLLALKNLFVKEEKIEPSSSPPGASSRRVRVTGPVR